MKKKTSLLAFIITAVMVFSLWPQQVNATGGNAARTTTADNVTINNWPMQMHWMTVQRMWGVYGRISPYRQVM